MALFKRAQPDTPQHSHIRNQRGENQREQNHVDHLTPSTTVSDAPLTDQMLPRVGPSTPTTASVAPLRYFHLTSYLIGLLTALLLVGGLFVLLRPTEPAPIVLHPPPTAAPTATPLPTVTPPPLVVFVSGAVQQPGIYTLAPEARVGDAVTAAGGMTLQANPVLINQAERLWDGAQIHIPVQVGAADALTSPDENAASAPAEPPAGLTKPGGALADLATDAQTANSLIRINHAAPAELESLPGIGPSKAAAIVVNRPYATIDELEKVPGIGAKTVEELRPLVTVE